ncbi:MAG TPA: hypothetical protein VJ846_00945 [Sphingomicrobium sp.]|nr:hypothetical protein [Sphingomicrobium sp.]
MRTKIGRLSVIAIAALLLSVQIIRDAAVKQLAVHSPSQAAQIWSGHPAVEIALAMAGISKAARTHRPVPSTAFAMMDDAAFKAPLAPEPFLVRGVQDELRGDGSSAQRAFEAAQWRDPRSLPAAYFLAQRYFHMGDGRRGLREVAGLARLSPNGSLAVAPYLAAYAKRPENWPALRATFRANPGIAEPVLMALAGNADTAPAVLALADPKEKAGDAPWLAPLLNSLIAAGKYEEAVTVWKRTTRVNAPGLVYDSAFRDRNSPPPFNWSLTSSTVGVAERQAGRLHVIFYGQEDGILASQLLLLERGQYRFSMQLVGNQPHAHSLTWSIWCDKSEAPIASVNLDVAANRSWNFAVPANCPAQWLRLSGTSSDIPQQVDVMVASLRLEKANPSA